MNILLFGGNSQRNQQWIHEVGENLAPDFNKCVVHDYEHWNGRGEFIDFEAELLKLATETNNLGHYVVFAKSVGSILTLKAIDEGILEPEKCIFAGLPIKLAEEDGIDLPHLLKSNSVPTLLLQNAHDPLASYSHLVEYVRTAGAAGYTTVELEGDTHSYDNLAQLKALVHSFVFAATES